MFVLFNIELLFTFQWKREQLGQKSKGAVISFLHIFLIKNVGGGGGGSFVTKIATHPFQNR